MRSRWLSAAKPSCALIAALVALAFLSLAWLNAKLADDLAAGRAANERLAELIATTVSTELNRGNYSGLSKLFEQWSSSNSDLLGIELRASNGFDLAKSVRQLDARHVDLIERPIAYSYHGQARLVVRASLDRIFRAHRNFSRQFFGIFLAFSTLLAGLAFLAIRSRKDALRAQRVTNLYSALSEVNQAIVRMENGDQLFPLVCRCSVDFGGLSMACVALADEESDLLHPVARYGARADMLDRLAVCGTAAGEPGFVDRAYRDNRPVIIDDIAAASTPAPWRDALGKAGWKCAAAFPILRGGQPHAVLSVYHAEAGALDEKIVVLLDEMARDISFALDNFDRGRQIHFLAYHDSLTGLPNRELARDHFDLARSFADRAHSKIGILFLDLDDFKSINDSLGHNIGDKLLKATSSRLKAHLRSTDTLCRQGGDEFLILLADVPDEEAIARIVDKLLKEISRPAFVEGHELSISMSLGIAIYPDDGGDFHELLKKADTAMYRAKEAEKNAFRFFTEQMNADAMEHMHLRTELRRAIEHSEFVLHYQPQFDLEGGRVVGAEALIRWYHPERGYISPGRFIPIAEKCGLIAQIGDWVILEACRQAMLWCEAGLPPLTIAINISAVQFKSRTLEKSLVQALIDSGVDPACIELELTESILVKDVDSILATMRSFKERGINLSIDDFGTGYSSLAYLKRLDVDKIKIDQSFIKELSSSRDDAALVQAIIQMAKALDLRTVAEGIESDEALQLLKAWGCNEAQGYYLAKPMEADAFRRFVAGINGKCGLD